MWPRGLGNHRKACHPLQGRGTPPLCNTQLAAPTGAVASSARRLPGATDCAPGEPYVRLPHRPSLLPQCSRLLKKQPPRLLRRGQMKQNRLQLEAASHTQPLSIIFSGLGMGEGEKNLIDSHRRPARRANCYLSRLNQYMTNIFLSVRDTELRDQMIQRLIDAAFFVEWLVSCFWLKARRIVVRSNSHTLETLLGHP
ncbi:hypothetical protein CAPTEDRAFT_206793 [Capitella teleta]|uniref:Uncharacterized protein n=1 Tax=Capitella teleta TaxID=283909 RepID=R7VHT3_CAPTE|nr:hypothetical protein CAPTEDRAFT_206793 [Capitella teleta]|eukprot:ELU18127.1 hypothetical protein CAPTEDRAFT_206793 [Capitella teleta]